MEFIQQNFANKISVDAMAESVNMSPSHFMRVFKKETGATPNDYLLKIRIKDAEIFLKLKTFTITEIALRCGFSTASHFSSTFQKSTGLSPSEFRKKHRGQDFERK